MENKTPQLADVVEIFSNMPYGQLVFLGLFAATWLVGGNILIAFHFRRIGKPWYSGLIPFSWPFRNFNKREWVILGVLFVLSAIFGIVALSYSNV
jgi:hypothetical protein